MSYSAISVSQTVISSGTVSEVLEILQLGIGGLDENGNQVEKPVLTGNYLLDEVIENSDIEAIRERLRRSDRQHHNRRLYQDHRLV